MCKSLTRGPPSQLCRTGINPESTEGGHCPLTDRNSGPSESKGAEPWIPAPPCPVLWGWLGKADVSQACPQSGRPAIQAPQFRGRLRVLACGFLFLPVPGGLPGNLWKLLLGDNWPSLPHAHWQLSGLLPRNATDLGLPWLWHQEHRGRSLWAVSDRGLRMRQGCQDEFGWLTSCIAQPASLSTFLSLLSP